MSDPHKPADGGPQEEWVPEDDAVIGKAFRISLLVILVLGVAGALAYQLWQRPEAAAPERAIEAAAPQAVSRPASAPTVRFSDVAADVGIGVENIDCGSG